MNKKALRRKAIKRREATLRTARKITDNLWMLEYKSDYGLKGLLDHGVSSVLGLVLYLQKTIHLPMGIPNPAGSDGACTTFNAETPDGKVIMGRNFDFKESPCTVVWTSPADGYRSFAVCNNNLTLYAKLDPKKRRHLRLMGTPYASMDGMNEKGLAAAILELISKPTKQDTGRTPITSNVALRGILDYCADVDEAIEFLKKYDMHDLLGACYHYQFTDANGKTAIVEYLNGEMHVFRQKRADESLVLTNFFKTEGAPEVRRNGMWRYKKARECLDNDRIMSESQAMDLLESVREYYQSKYKIYYIITNWSAVYNCTDKSILFCPASDYSVKYRFCVDKPCTYQIVK